VPASFASTKLESDITLIRESPLDSFSSENALVAGGTPDPQIAASSIGRL